MAERPPGYLHSTLTGVRRALCCDACLRRCALPANYANRCSDGISLQSTSSILWAVTLLIHSRSFPSQHAFTGFDGIHRCETLAFCFDDRGRNVAALSSEISDLEMTKLQTQSELDKTFFLNFGKRGELSNTIKSLKQEIKDDTKRLEKVHRVICSRSARLGDVRRLRLMTARALEGFRHHADKDVP